MVKIVTLFLIVMLVMGMFGRFRWIGRGLRTKHPQVETARKCRQCGRYRIGSDPCDCAK